MSQDLKPKSQNLAFRAIAAIFLVNGLTLSSWISRIPAIADELDLGTGQVGTALMALAAGAIVAFPITGRLVDRRSSGQTLFLFGLVMFLTLPVIGLAPHLLVLMPILFVFGAGNGGMDVSMNAQGIEVERAGGRSIMNSLHGYFSLGAVLGAGGGALAASLDVPPFAHLMIVMVIGLAVLARVRNWLIPDVEETRRASEPAPAFALPPRSLWALGALAMATSISEGAMADWSGLYLHEHLETSSGFAALGYASFSILMLVGRFAGDGMVARFGAPAMVRYGGALAAIGLGIAVLVNEPVVMLFGFGSVGLGLSVAYPLVFSAAGNHPTLPRGQAVASVATLGYAGFLAGPPLLGWLAEPTSLRLVLVIVVLLAASVAVLANATKVAATRRPQT